jgi:hypothetical protein
VLDYEIGSSVEYGCNHGYEMIGAHRAYCTVPSEWYPLPPICKCKSPWLMIQLDGRVRSQIIHALRIASSVIRRQACVCDNERSSIRWSVIRRVMTTRSVLMANAPGQMQLARGTRRRTVMRVIHRVHREHNAFIDGANLI